MNSRVFFQFVPLSPICVSSGQELDPLRNAVIKDGEDYWLYWLDFDAWLRDAAAAGAKLNYANGSALRDALRTRYRDYVLARVKISAAAGNPQSLDRDLALGKKMNGKLAQFYRDPLTLEPYLPGSSLKGALVTPLLDHLDDNFAKDKLSRLRDMNLRASGDILAKAFGPIGESALKALKIPDIPLPANSTKIVSAITRRRDRVDKSVPRAACEAIKIKFGGIYGSLGLSQVKNVAGIKIKSKEFTFTQIAEICTEFYKKRFGEENAKFYRSGLPINAEAMEFIEKLLVKLSPNKGLFLRLGRHSHIECVSLSHNDPKHKKGWGRTRAAADNETPFGWAVLLYCKVENYFAARAKIDAEREKLIAGRVARI